MPEQPTETNVDQTHAARLEALAVRVAGCTACPLAATRTQTVFGEGNPDAPLGIVGEGPGEQEDQTGRPFVGRAGMLLDECLLANGITRRHVYICNVLKCRACIIEGGRARNRPPAPEEMRACYPWLTEQLGILRPLVILSVGAPSAKTLIDPDIRMLQHRGQWRDGGAFCRHIMAVLHPAFILRHGGDEFQRFRQMLIDDIGSARRKVIEAKKQPQPTLF
ncbi:MAG: uracil-DNA glycosylase [Armatimonadetes bacterium]|nr:uracil-DNA glycosylase [Armatimonadota bacterium]